MTTFITKVDDSISRSRRPDEDEYAGVKALFASVISLEGSEEDERETRELSPVTLIAQPISSWEIYVSGITQVRLSEILASIARAPKPCLVHCQHGQDRTGLVIAAYRVRVCEWTKGQAMDEALKFGYRSVINWGLNKTWKAFS